MSLSVIVASGGRRTLGQTLASVNAQLDVEDEVLVIVDQLSPGGHSSRNRMMLAAKGDHLLFVDDDVELAPGALGAVRAAVRQDSGAVHVFDGSARPPSSVRATQIVVPNRPPLPAWSSEFVATVCRHCRVRWHDQPITIALEPARCTQSVG